MIMKHQVSSGRARRNQPDTGQHSSANRKKKEETPSGQIENHEVPKGWSKLPLRSVADIRAGGSAPQGQSWFGGTNPFIRVQHLDKENDWVRRWDLITDGAVAKYKLRLFPKGTIVLPKSGASIRLEKRAVLTTNAYLVSHLAAVNPKQNIIHPDFLFFSLRLMKLAEEKADGYPTLNLSELSQTQILFPSLPEQKTIAAILRTVQEAKEACERIIAATRQLKQSLLRYLFTYGPVPFDRADQVLLKETEIGHIPTHWEIAHLSNCSAIRYGLGQPPKNSATGIPMVRATNVKRGRIVAEGLIYVDRDALPPKRNPFLREGDIIVVRSGAYTGDIGLVDKTWAGAVAGYDLIATPKQGFDSRVLAQYLLGPSSQNYFRSQRDRSAQPHLNSHQLGDTPVPVIPEQEQRLIAECLSILDAKFAAEEARRNSLANLFQSLLHHLMTGKVRIAP